MAETVAFLFADLAGSTRLLTDLGASAYAQLLTDYRRTVEDSAAAEGGHVVDREGDGLFLVVPTAAGALRAAPAAQQRLAAASWPDGADVSVRMGIHVGEAHAHDQGYVGLDINRAARVGALAHGGQVLVSEAARLLAADSLGGDIGLWDLGEYRLKGLDRLERIHQLLAPGLPDRFPPLGSDQGATSNVGPRGRLAVVWTADIVGLGGVASRDEATAVGLVRLLQERARAEIGRHGGTLSRFTEDGVLAHAEDATDALHAVLAVTASFREASRARGEPALLRAAAHSGEIATTAGVDAGGQAVEIAARLRHEARPGQVLVSEDVWRRARHGTGLRFTALGPLDLDGVDAPIWTYEVGHPGGDRTAATTRWAPGAAGDRLVEARSIAILPFQIVGCGDDVEFLAVGLHNDLRTELSKVPELTVISRTSVLGYRETAKPIPHIARELDVGTVVEGAVQSAGRRVRLTVQLIDGINDVHRWAESYDRELTTEELFDIQTELTQHITESLRAELVSDGDSAAEDGAATADLDAYRLAAQGRQQFDLKTQAGFLRAIDLFEEAFELDPHYADAWIGLADALALMEDYGYGDREELLARADEAVHRALALVPGSAGAHTSLGLLRSTYQDGPASIREFEHAIRRQPSYADAHNWHAWISLILGRGDVALVSARRAVEVNPLSAEPVSNLALSYLATKRPADALVEARRARELSPFTTAAFFEGIALFDLGRFAEACEILEPLAVRTAGELTVPWAKHGPDVTLALASVALGEHDEARAILRTIDEAEHPLATGLVLLALEQADDAVTALGRVQVTSAWPSLAIHHHYCDVWARIHGTDAHRELLRTAHRSWCVDPPDGG